MLGAQQLLNCISKTSVFLLNHCLYLGRVAAEKVSVYDTMKYLAFSLVIVSRKCFELVYKPVK